jgi:phosphomannomutase
MIRVLRELRKKVVVGFVGGSDLVKISEQLSVAGSNGSVAPYHDIVYIPLIHDILVIDDFDYAFAENGLTAYKLGKALESQSFIKFVDEERYKVLVNFILHYIADMDIPIKRWFLFSFSNTLF